jgi:hypothetical protein
MMQRRGRHATERSQGFEISTFWDCVILVRVTSFETPDQSYPANESLTW